MLRLLRLAPPVGLLILAGVVLWAAPVPADPGAVLDDPSADTVDEDDGTALDVPEADILRSSATGGPDGITLNVVVRQPTDPLSAPAWEGATEIEWELDTTGDGVFDFYVEYFTDSGRITGEVYRSDDDVDDAPPLCIAKSATFDATAGYRVVIDPACIGRPETVAYSVLFSYDTGPDDENAPVAEDYSPDSGLSPRVPVTQAETAMAPPSNVAPVAGPASPEGAAAATAALAGDADTATATPAPPAPAQHSTAKPVAAPPASPGAPAPPPDVPAMLADDAETEAAAASDDAGGADGAVLARTGARRQPLVAWAGASIALGGLCVMFGAVHTDSRARAARLERVTRRLRVASTPASPRSPPGDTTASTTPTDGDRRRPW